jgi:hypothetical protein
VSKENKMSLRETIFGADDITKELVEVPEWGVSVEIRSMTAAERAGLTEASTAGSANKVDISLMYALCVIATVYDPETGLPIFKKGDETAILSKNGSVIERLATKAMGSSGFTDTAVDEAANRFPQES